MDPNLQNQPNPPTQPGVPTYAPPGIQTAPQPVYPEQPLSAPLPGSVQPNLAGVTPNQAPPPYQPMLGAPQQQPSVGGQPQQPVPKLTVKSNPNSTQNALHVAEIRDGIVIMDDGSYRAVVMCKSINFDLMSPQEREAVEFSYQGFLNSLYFPIQIFIRSSRVDLGPYIQKLDKIRSEHDNMLLALLMEDYVVFMDQLSQQTNIMDKKFYIIIPYLPMIDMQKTVQASKGFIEAIVGKTEEHVTINEADLEQAKTELKNRVQAVMQGLQQAGIQSLPLDTQELIELFYDAYNPDTAARQQLKNFSDLSAPIVTKGQGSAPQPHLNKELQ